MQKRNWLLHKRRSTILSLRSIQGVSGEICVILENVACVELYRYN